MMDLSIKNRGVAANAITRKNKLTEHRWVPFYSALDK